MWGGGGGGGGAGGLENIKLRMGDYHLKPHLLYINMGGCHG
jgi:hypothetical protein